MARSPLFDIYDPYGILQQQAQFGMLPEPEEDIEPYGLVPIDRKPTISDLMPQEEKTGMLRSLANLGASGLTGLGWLLDIPGSLVRGTISGVAEGDPFKGVRTAFGSSEERVSGRDLLRQFGAAGDEDTWGNFGTGLLTEIATDPLSLLNPAAILGRGAYGAAGRALSRAGILDNAALMAQKQGMGVRKFLRKPAKEIIGLSDNPQAMQDFAQAARGKGLDPDALLNQPAAGLMEFRIPGMEQGQLLGTGAIGDWTASALDRAGEGLKSNRFTAPVVNRLTAAFDPTVMGELDPSKQWRNRAAWDESLKNERAFLEWAAERQRAAMSVGKVNGFSFSDARIQNAVRDTIEAKLDPQRIAKLQDQEAIAALESVPEWKAWRDDAAERLQESRERRMARGLEAPDAQSLEDIGFFPSQSVWFNNPQAPVLPNRLDRQQRAYERGQRVLNTDDLVGRSRSPKTDLDRRSETLRRLMAGDFGRKLQDDLIKAGDDDVPVLIDRAFAELGMESPFGGVRADGLSMADITAQRDLADQAERLLTNWRTAPKSNTVKAKIADFGTLLDEVAQVFGVEGSFASMDPQSLRTMRGLLRKPRGVDSLRKQLADAEAAIKTQQNALKTAIGDTLRRADRQFADKNMGLFDQNTVNDMVRYGLGQARSEANAKVILDDLLQNASPLPAQAVPGGGSLNLLEAASQLGFNKAALTDILKSRMGPNIDPAMLSINEKVFANLKRLAPGRQIAEPSALGRFWDTYTNAFKVGALANPAYHTRNLYSGYLSTLMGGGQNPVSNILDWYAGRQAGLGNYTKRGMFGLMPSVADRIRQSPRYAHLSEEEAVDAFLREAARNRLGGGLVDEAEGVAEQAAKGLYPGADAAKPPPVFGERGILYDPNRTWQDWLTVRGVDWSGFLGDRPAPSQTTNPLLQLHERIGRQTEDANRLGTYIAQLRQGASPDAAARQVYKTQVDYSPRAFTEFERQLKRWIPFYSYTRGIAPSVAENLLYRPGGLQGQSMRAISRASEPNEDFFTPEYLRQSAAIPLPGAAPAEGLQRFLTNIDLPYEGLVNLFSPGIGNTGSQVAIDSLQKTGMNLLGMVNPLVKAPLEMVLNRQLYSGRELSDLYSVFENSVDPQWGPLARALEQVVVNMPGGSKLNSLIRTGLDDRLSASEKAAKIAINNLAGLKVTDVDQERTRRLAARETLEELLSSTPGVRTYENLTVPEDVLRAMPEQQRRMYLLYKVIQAEAAKRAREKKKAALDPLQMLGVVNQF